MATVERTSTGAFVAASRALDRAIDAAVEGAATHASGTTFVPADLVASGRVRAYRRLGAVTVVDADGNELRLARDRTVEVAVSAGFVLALVLLLHRRRSRA